MRYEKRLLQPILNELDKSRIHADALAARRKNEVYEALPAIAEIDEKLQSTVLEIVRNAFSHGGDVRAPLAAVREENLALQHERAELLREAGFAENYTEPQYSCPLCNDTGYVGQDVCTCVDTAYRAAISEELSQSIGFGVKGFESFRLDLYSDRVFRGDESPRAMMEEVLSFSKNYVRNFRETKMNLLICGETGSGKTLLSACIAQAVAQTGARVVFETAFRLFSRFEDERFGRSQDDGFSTSRYYEADLLVIDALGGEVATQYTNAVLGDLIASRELRGKPILINTCLSREELLEKYKKQLVAKIEGIFTRVPLFGQDNRGK